MWQRRGGPPWPSPPCATPALPSEADRVNAAAAVAHSAISQLQARTARIFADDRVYPVPNPSIYAYDDTSGYYYDPSTGLYYDASSRYYYDNRTGRYLYWNAATATYSPVPTATATKPSETATNSTPEPPESKKRCLEKPNKVKVAKRIAKDMERWAKTLNQKKDVARRVPPPETVEGTSARKSSGSADIGFSVLESHGRSTRPALTSLLRETDDSAEEEDETVDLDKLACLLCKRQFPSREILEKHLKLSDLHRRNLEEKGGTVTLNGQREDDSPLPTGKTRSILKSGSESSGRGFDREGRNLDFSDTGVALLEAGPERKRGIYAAGPGETYRDCVKKMTIARYRDLMENEADT